MHQRHGDLGALGVKSAQIKSSVRPGRLPRTPAQVRRSPVCAPELTKVSHLVSLPALTPPLARALAERNYDSLTPVQLAVLAHEATSRDLLVSAQTGSGKTVA